MSIASIFTTPTKKFFTTAADASSPGRFFVNWIDDMIPKQYSYTSGDYVKSGSEWMAKYGDTVAGGINIVWYGIGALILYGVINTNATDAYNSYNGKNSKRRSK